MKEDVREIIIAEDDAILRAILVDRMRDQFRDFEILEASDGEEALQFINRRPPSLLVLNMMMPRKRGAVVLRELSRRKERFPIVVTSRFIESAKTISELCLIPQDRFAYLHKPFSEDTLIRIARELIS